MLHSPYRAPRKKYVNLYGINNKTEHLIHKLWNLITACPYENGHTISRDVVLTKLWNPGQVNGCVTVKVLLDDDKIHRTHKDRESLPICRRRALRSVSEPNNRVQFSFKPHRLGKIITRISNFGDF